MPAAKRHRERHNEPIRCKTMEAVIDALGGAPEVAKLTGKSINHISNWKRDTRRFPAKTYPAMRDALEAKGFTAPLALWGMLEP